MAAANKIFISYRREDAADAAGRIRDWLVQERRVAKDDVFMDVTAILPGANFMHVIEEKIGQCTAMIVVISPSWLAQINAPVGTYLRAEAEAALRHNLLVIPVLVGGVQMPAAESLPASLRSLTWRNAKQIRPDSFDYDMDFVRKALGIKAGVRVAWTAAISALLLVGLTLGIFSQVPVGNPIWALVHPPSIGVACQRAFTGAFSGGIDARWQTTIPEGSNIEVDGQNQLVLSTSSTGHDLYPGNYTAPRILQEMDGNFTIMTHVLFQPAATYEGAGLLIWQDETNFIRLERAAGDTQGIEFDVDQQGNYNRISLTSRAPTTSSEVNLRLTRQGDQFTAAWREAGDAGWNEIGETNLHLTDLMVGLHLVNASPVANITAGFTDFTVTCG